MKHIKRGIFCILSVLVLSLTGALYINAAPGGKSLGSVPKAASDAVKIDAVKDGCYDGGLKTKISWIKGDANPKIFAQAYILWTDGWLFVYADVTDSSLTGAVNSTQTTSPWLADSLELFVDDNNDGKDYGMQYRIDYTGYGTWKDRSANKNYYTPDAVGTAFSYAGKISSSGYSVEFKVPLKTSDNQKVGIMFQLNAVPDVYLLSETTANQGWQTSEYPYIVLSPSAAATSAATVAAAAASDASKAAPAASGAVKAPATADSTGIFAVLFFTSVLMFGILRKKRCKNK